MKIIMFALLAFNANISAGDALDDPVKIYRTEPNCEAAGQAWLKRDPMLPHVTYRSYMCVPVEMAGD